MNNKILIILIAVLLIAAIAVVLFVFVFNGDKELPYVRTEFSPGEYFVTNVKDSNRLLKITVVLILNTDTLTEFMEERSTEIRDTIVHVLRNQEEATLRAIDLSALKEEIKETLNERLEIENITDILFSDIAVQ